MSGKATGSARPLRRRLAGQAQPPERLRCLYNGYFLTVDPAKALDSATTVDRHRLYVLHALLVDPDTGRIAAVFPALGTPAVPGGPVAHPISDYPALQNSETPPSPGLLATQLATYWRQAGVDETLLDTTEWVDLVGAVATAGLTDTHFHVSSWSKKLPAPGERFGFYADLSDPAYYVNPADWSRRCAREAMWQIVTDASLHLRQTGAPGIFLHGYLYTEVDSGPSGQLQPAYLYDSASSCDDAGFNPVYLLNRIGAHELTPPFDPCSSDPSSWPPIDDPVLPALLVHTSGQACWYNSALLASYNDRQEARGSSLSPLTLASVTPVGSTDAEWILAVSDAGSDADVLFDAATPYQVDVVVAGGGTGGSLTVPFDVIATDPIGRTLTGRAMIPELATSALAGSPTPLTLVPFYRRIVECIPRAKWEAATAYWGQLPGNETVAYGAWDPRDPYATNWYNGAKRGLVQYFFDAPAAAWRPTGYAEHYPMRDALAAVVVTAPSVTELMEHRRRLASWCHRHGITMVNDIMFYRRAGESKEFEACEGLSFDHHAPGETEYYSRAGVAPSVPTGGFNLRLGLYYYLEKTDDVTQVLRLAHDANNGSDVERLLPAPHHPEHPGWVRWLGWKLQLDGGTGARTLFSNAPIPKPRQTDSFATVDDSGAAVTFRDHSFGLLTMTDVQEQIFTSRETAALYWLIRESDQGSPFYNQQITTNWTVFAKGVVGFLGASVDQAALARDLSRLAHVSLDSVRTSQLAGKVATLLQQVNDGWERTLSAIIRIWYERSLPVSGVPTMPGQVSCHAIGDGAVDLWARAVKQLKTDVENLPTQWSGLPARWKSVVPEGADLTSIRRSFADERFRIEHLLNVSAHVIEDVMGTGGIDDGATAAARNIVFSTQPSLYLLDGVSMAGQAGFPRSQELWPIPNLGDTWNGLPAWPRFHHFMPLPTYLAQDVPFSLSTDPPSVRDPRPALTVIASVARTAVEIDPSHWVDQTAGESINRPPDYLAGKVYDPFGYAPAAGTNPMQLTVEQTLAAMTFWGAYSAGMEREVGALAVPTGQGQPGWFADLVVWRANPLAIAGSGGPTLEDLGRMPAGADDAARLATVNAFITKFLPKMTVVGGVKVFEAD